MGGTGRNGFFVFAVGIDPVNNDEGNDQIAVPNKTGFGENDNPSSPKRRFLDYTP